MNIYYAASKGFNNKDLENLVCHTIPAELKKSGHEVYCFIYDPSEPDSNMGFDEIVSNINNSDLFISEMSRASQTLGFQLAYAMNLTKPCLYLYHQSRDAKPHTAIQHHPSRLLQIKPYSHDNFAEVLSKFITYGNKQLASIRTSFMSTRAIDQYLNDRSKKLGTHKAEIIRQLLDDAIKKEI